MANERHGRRERKLQVVATPSAQLLDVDLLIEHMGAYLREMLDEGLLYIENGVIRARH